MDKATRNEMAYLISRLARNESRTERGARVERISSGEFVITRPGALSSYTTNSPRVAADRVGQLLKGVK